ncbi:MAG: hypothetical protein LBV41_03920 [Cytophagaceae bacterium]|jgi:hypothetical protein|nr:hypothetical protein [Cytophagaceae bacterium]
MKTEETYSKVIELLRNNMPEIENADGLLHSIMKEIEPMKGAHIRLLRVAGAVSGIAALLLSGFLIYETALPKDYLYINASYAGKTVSESAERLPMPSFASNAGKASYLVSILKDKQKQGVRKKRIYAKFVERMETYYSK